MNPALFPRMAASSGMRALMATIFLAWTTACGSSDATGGTDPAGLGGSPSAIHNPTGGAAGRVGSGAAGAGAVGTGVAGVGPFGTGGAGGAGNGNGTAGKGAGGAVLGAGGSAGSGVGGSSGSGGKGPGGSEILVPASGALLGQYYGDGNITATKAKLGRTLAIHLNYWGWDDDWTSGETADDLAAGRIPLVSWEPADIDFKNIISGSLDATIKARAAGAKALKKQFFLDFAAEMNGDEAWSGNDAKLYIDAYRHIHDLFVAAGATNVVWAWCPNVTDTDGTNTATLSYYPGDDYVDWTGVDGYNWGASEWQSFHDIFKDIYPLLAGKKKPILIGEMASSETGGSKADWLKAMIPSLKSDFPLIKAVVWFDVNKERDWRISSSTATEQAFRAMASDPFFNP